MAKWLLHGLFRRVVESGLPRSSTPVDWYFSPFLEAR